MEATAIAISLNLMLDIEVLRDAAISLMASRFDDVLAKRATFPAMFAKARAIAGAISARVYRLSLMIDSSHRHFAAA